MCVFPPARQRSTEDSTGHPEQHVPKTHDRIRVVVLLFPNNQISLFPTINICLFCLFPLPSFFFGDKRPATARNYWTFRPWSVRSVGRRRVAVLAVSAFEGVIIGLREVWVWPKGGKHGQQEVIHKCCIFWGGHTPEVVANRRGYLATFLRRCPISPNTVPGKKMVRVLGMGCG